MGYCPKRRKPSDCGNCSSSSSSSSSSNNNSGDGGYGGGTGIHVLLPANSKLVQLMNQPNRSQMVQNFVRKGDVGATFSVKTEALLELVPEDREGDTDIRERKRYHLQRRDAQSSAVCKGDDVVFVTPRVGIVMGTAAQRALPFDNPRKAIAHLGNKWGSLQTYDMNGNVIETVMQLETFYDRLIGKGPCELIEFEYDTHYLSAHFTA